MLTEKHRKIEKLECVSFVYMKQIKHNFWGGGIQHSM